MSILIPTLVQNVVWSSNWLVDTGNGFKLNLPNATLFNNCLILKMLYPNTVKWIKITDNMGNTWPTKPNYVAKDTSNGQQIAIFVLFGVPAGVKQIIVNFNAAINGFNPAFQEWAGIAASNATDGQANTFNVQNPITPGAFSTGTSGDLILQFAQTTDFLGDASGKIDTITIFNAQNGIFIQTDPQNAGYFCQYEIQGTAGSVNLVANAVFTATPGSYGFATVTFALKASTTTGTLPSPIGTRIVGEFHLRLNGSGATGNVGYAVQWPTFGNLLVGGCSDPAATISISGVTGNVSGTWNVVPNGGGASLVHKESATNSTNEILNVILNDLAAHDYVQGVFFDVANGGAFDTSNTTEGGTTFGPGNSTPVAPIVPGVMNGITIVEWGIDSGPPDSVVAPANVHFASVFYTGETDPSSMDNGDLFATYIFNTNAVQNWVFHNTVSTTGYGVTMATFGATLQPQAPFKFYGNGAFQANSFVEGGMPNLWTQKLYANTTAQINSMVEIASPTRTKMYANGQVQTPQFLEFMY